jgi:hypothetical protein
MVTAMSCLHNQADCSVARPGNDVSTRSEPQAGLKVITRGNGVLTVNVAGQESQE